MKEPYQIYFDEVRTELRRRSKPSPHGLGHDRVLDTENAGDASAQVAAAEEAAAYATAYHLVDMMHFRPDDAQDVVAAFRAAPFDLEKLKHAWTDYILTRGNRG